MKLALIISLILALFPGCSKKSQAASQDENTVEAQDIGWPRQVSDQTTTLVYYQPQIDKWDKYTKLSGRFAFSMTSQEGAEVVGVASFECDTKTDKDARTTYLHDINYTDVRFPSLSEDSVALMKKTFLSLMPAGAETISMDRVLAYLDNDNHPAAQTVSVKNDPPKIFYSASPAILLIVDGDPVLSPVEKTNLQFVVNTNWDLFLDKKSNQYYLLIDDVWLTSKNPDGNWTQTTTLPQDFSKLPSGQNFDEVIKMVPPQATNGAPVVFYSNTPAELILTEGSPVYSAIPGTQLLYIANTDNDIFIDQTSKQYYILLSGRWFSASQFGGPWAYAGNNLPPDFAKIPEDSPKAHVLASVPGTVEASDAVLLSQVPTTVMVNRSQAEAEAKVTYDGSPQFAPIEGTSMQYATNTQDKVIKVGDLYYMCFQAVWFVSTSPDGPWKTADSVPSEIYTIPPSSPVYNVIYVTQTNATSTTVESSSTAGYLGAFIIGATVGAIVNTAIVYGTGWYYHPYVYWPPRAVYPIYRPWPCTYGAGAVYNPWTGGWATGRRAYGPYGSLGTSAWYNPATGRYGRSASVQGWYGGRSAASVYNPWTGSYGHTSQAHSPYAQWGSSVVTHGSQWARSAHVTTAGGTAFAYETSRGREGVVVDGRHGASVHANNGSRVYAGRDGNVYRKNDNGSWSEYNNNHRQWQESKVGTTENHNIGKTEQHPAGQQRIGGTTHNTNTRQVTENPPRENNLGGATHTPAHSNTLQDLNRSDQSRARGDRQSQRFQEHRREGNSHLGGGSLRRR